MEENMKKIALYLVILCLFLNAGCTIKARVGSNGEVYKNDKLGFTITFPDSWKGMYRVEESDEGITVFFLPKQEAEYGDGSLFCIIKQESNSDAEEFLDNIGEQRYFKAKGINYIIGGPTDVDFPPEHPEFNTFMKMSEEKDEVLKTLKPIG
jgi:hypothetical protein